MTDANHLLGRRVVVQNPHHPESRWEGVAVAWSDRPSILIEDGDDRYMLPAQWASEADVRPDS